jgi:hypothetical protein
MVILLEFAYLYLFWMGFIKAKSNFTGFDSERLQVIDIPNLGFDGGVLMDFGFMRFVFLYMSYYGTDQTGATINICQR